MKKLGDLMMILDLHWQGLKLAVIARRVGVDRKTVHKYIARGLEPPFYDRRGRAADQTFGTATRQPRSTRPYGATNSRVKIPAACSRKPDLGLIQKAPRIRQVRPAASSASLITSFKSGFRSRCIIASGCEVIGAFLVGVEIEDTADGALQAVDCALGGF